MRHSIATVTLSGTLLEKLYAVSAAKFDCVEIFDNELFSFDGSPAELKELIGQLGLEISLFQPYFDLEGTPDDAFKAGLSRLERKLDLMAEIGAPTMLLSSNASRSAIDDDARAADQLRQAAEAAAARGLRLAYEATAWGAHVKTYKDAWRLVQRVDHPAFGLVLDGFHTLAQGVDLDGIAEIAPDRIFAVQLSDAPEVLTDLSMVGRHFRGLPGQGRLDLVGFTARALERGYRGPLSVEVFSDDFKSAPTRSTAVEAKRSLLYIEEGVRRRGLKSPVAAELFDPPPPPRLDGVAFVEFAVDDGAATELGGWLSELGFARVGRHRTKAVDLYQQGEVYIVLNASPDSFAYAYLHLHGPSVCALGLRVRDRDALMRRAEAYQYRLHEEQTGEGEYAMPAIRAPDGSLIHLVDQAYDPWQDFVPTGETPGAARLTAFDHVARAVPVGQFESWVLYYRLLLGLSPEPVWDLADPHGLVHSRAFSDEGGTVRFPLSFSDSARTVVARSLSSFRGAGVNQVAFGTPDIFAAVEAIRARGGRLLPIPANYYVELATETGLPPATLDRLRESQVLYDRDDQGGEFLHAYTEVFHDRFFFEVGQRSGGYAQYGAVNAPVRMAAQSRRRRPVEA